jgi:hypothetical protein
MQNASSGSSGVPQTGQTEAAAGGDGWPTVAGDCADAAGMATTGAPHDMQKASSGASRAPQDTHDGPSGALAA